MEYRYERRRSIKLTALRKKKEKKKKDAVNFSQSESTGRKILHGEDDGNKSTIPSREDREKLEREKKKEI